MIILSNTTDKIQVKLSVAPTTNQLPCYASYRDTTVSSIEAKRNVLNTNGTNAVDLVDSPASSTQRIVDYLSIYNSDTTSATVTLQFNDNGSLYNLTVVVLNSGEKLEYQEGVGFKVLNSSGSVRVSDNDAGILETSTLNFLLKPTNQSTTTTTYGDVNGLTFSITAGKTYWFKFVCGYTASATNQGIKFAVNGPASPTYLSYKVDWSNGSNLLTIQRGLNTYDASVASTGNNGAGNLSILEGIIIPSTSGTLALRFGNQSAGQNNTVRAGSIGKYIVM